MKNLLLVIAVALFTTAAFAQDAQADKKAEAKPATTTEKKMATHCYAMQNGAMMHCMGSKAEPMTKDVTLKNGTKVTTKGEITTKDGKKSMLANGQCIDVHGTVGDYNKMHAGMKMDDKSK